MCNSAGLFVLLSAIAARPLAAQAIEHQRLRARTDSLPRELTRASAIADLADSLEHQRAFSGRDTIAVGGLRIVTDPSPLPVRAAAERAWPVLDSLYGDAAQLLAQYPYVIRAFDPDTTAPRPTVYVGLTVPWNMNAEILAQLLVANPPMPAPDYALASWLGGTLRPTTRAGRERTDVYLQLVTAPSTPARACFLGALAACRIALGLQSGGDVLALWYPEAAERRALVTRTFPDYFNHGANAGAFRVCAGGVDSVCDALLRQVSAGSLPSPLGAQARTTVLRLALRLGGRDAYRRLIADSGAPLFERLGNAAQANMDDVLARWRLEILAARPPSVALPWWAAALALAWAAVFGTCALRSSRWRLG
ncbi:MAG: hypothetical protein E6J45_11590 [Chloroflexi bacterium]|nr:MAG: hypothetical protein E6J45_11590 [Chloroflexota bacterium]